MVVAGPEEDGGNSVVGSPAHCHRDLLPPCPAATMPTATVPFSQPGRRVSFALEWVQEQEETNDPPAAGCKSDKSGRL